MDRYFRIMLAVISHLNSIAKMPARVLPALLAMACQTQPLAPLAQTGGVDGYICDPNAHALAVGAQVTAVGLDGSITATCDATGYFKVAGLPTGPQVLQVHDANFSSQISVTVVNANTLHLPTPTCLTPQVGSITGRICGTANAVSAGNSYWLVGAQVTVQVGSGIFAQTTDANGYFTLTDVPAGLQTVRVTSGSFGATHQVTVEPNQRVDMASLCVGAATRMAVVTGKYDQVESVLTNLGFTVGACLTDDTSMCPDTLDPNGSITLVNGVNTSFYITNFLMDATLLSGFNIVFFDCGLADEYFTSAPAAAVTNVVNFVRQGGALYVSDWAYEIIRVAFANTFAFEGASVAQAARVGSLDMGLVARIEDATLAQAVGSANVSLVYNKGDWVTPQPTQQPNVVIWMQGDAPITTNGQSQIVTQAPLLLSTAVGDGRIIFTTFHNHSQVTDAMTAILRYVVFSL